MNERKFTHTLFMHRYNQLFVFIHRNLNIHVIVETLHVFLK